MTDFLSPHLFFIVPQPARRNVSQVAPFRATLSVICATVCASSFAVSAQAQTADNQTAAVSSTQSAPAASATPQTAPVATANVAAPDASPALNQAPKQNPKPAPTPSSPTPASVSAVAMAKSSTQTSQIAASAAKSSLSTKTDSTTANVAKSSSAIANATTSNAATTSANATTANATTANATTANATTANVTSTSERVIAININGRVVDTNPAPVLQSGAVLVPLRGVLENLGATVAFNAKTQGILINQGARRVVLVLNSRDAVVSSKTVQLSAPPQLIGTSTYVPLRSLAEIFGYGVQWLPATSTVVITNASGATMPTTDHRAALQAAGRLGIGISFVDGDSTVSDLEADRLLDAAKDAGASLIKVRFDWGVLEPKKGGAFNWAFYDRIVAGARQRGLTIDGVLGQSTQWASTFYKSNDPEQWRNGAPRNSELKSWQNYVRRVVGRYKNDVHAWQVWEKTSAERFRSSQSVYRKLLQAAANSARSSDASAIVFAAEPGGLDLDAISAFSQSSAAPMLSGVTLYPASQNQPGAPAAVGDFLRPYATIQTDNDLHGGVKHPLRDFWIGGLSRPILGENLVDLVQANAANSSATPIDPVASTPEIATDDTDLRASLLEKFTAQAQADYLLQSSALALAAGNDKVFWGELRDRASYESIAPINADFHSGLLKRDFTPRPSYSAFRVLVEQTKGKKYIGSLALGPDIVALVFDDGKNGSVVAWTTKGSVPLVVNSTGQNPGVRDSLYISSAGETQVLDAAGNALGNSQFVGTLTTRPLWITHIGYETRAAVRKADPRGVLLDSSAPSFVAAQGISADFSAAGNESGLYWRKFSAFRSGANKIVKADGRTGLMTEVSRNILDPAAGKFFIFLDADDDYLYMTRDVPVEVTVEVQRPAPETQTIVNAEAGFNIEYSTPNGTGRTPWQVVEAGSGWATYTFVLPDASFSNRGGYDLDINTFGSKKNLVFSSVSIRRQNANQSVQQTPNAITQP